MKSKMYVLSGLIMSSMTMTAHAFGSAPAQTLDMKARQTESTCVLKSRNPSVRLPDFLSGDLKTIAGGHAVMDGVDASLDFFGCSTPFTGTVRLTTSNPYNKYYWVESSGTGKGVKALLTETQIRVGGTQDRSLPYSLDAMNTQIEVGYIPMFVNLMRDGEVKSGDLYYSYVWTVNIP